MTCSRRSIATAASDESGEALAGHDLPARVRPENAKVGIGPVPYRSRLRAIRLKRILTSSSPESRVPGPEVPQFPGPRPQIVARRYRRAGAAMPARPSPAPATTPVPRWIISISSSFSDEALSAVLHRDLPRQVQRRQRLVHRLHASFSWPACIDE